MLNRKTSQTVLSVSFFKERPFQSSVADTMNWFQNSMSGSNQGLSEPEFYGDLVYKFKKTLGV